MKRATRVAFAILLLGLFAVAGCDDTRKARSPLPPPPSVVCGEVPPPVGERLQPAFRGWSLEAAGGNSELDRVASAGDEVVLLGRYEDTLVLDGSTLAGGGLFAARVGPDGGVTRLSRLATDPQRQARILAAAASADRLWVAISFVDQLEMLPDESPEVLTAPGSALAVVALTPEGSLERADVVRGNFAFEWEDTRLTVVERGVLLTTTVSFGGIEIDGTFAFSLAPVEDAFFPGHGVWVHFAEDGTSGWMVDGSAGSTLQAEMGAGYVTGRFGGDASDVPVARFGNGGPSLAAVSPDDDPAWDVFVGRADDQGARWVDRIRAYSSPGAVAAATHEGDLVVAVASGKIPIVFREGTAGQVDVASQNAIARFAPDGTLRWARLSAPIASLWDEGCGLWGLGALWAPWVAQPGEPDELRIELADGDLWPLLRLGDDGRVLAARTLAGTPGDQPISLKPIRPGIWLLNANRADGGAYRFAVQEVRW